MKAVTKTDFQLPGQVSKYTGKVRDVYSIDDSYIVMVATDRISAFDVVLPEGIPYKGQVLNQIASKFLDLTEDIIRAGSSKLLTGVLDPACLLTLKLHASEAEAVLGTSQDAVFLGTGDGHVEQAALLL